MKNWLGILLVFKERPKVQKNVTAFFDRVPGIRFNNPVIYPSADPNETFATYDVEIKVPENGRIYQQKYIGHFRQREGKLIYLSEYFGPTKTIEAFGA